jgi:hypothetical protein
MLRGDGVVEFQAAAYWRGAIMAKVKRNVYRVMPLTERHKLIGWKVTGPGGYTASFFHNTGLYKHDAIVLAVSLAEENQPSQVLISARSRKTGKYRVKEERSYGANSRAKG